MVREVVPAVPVQRFTGSGAKSRNGAKKSATCTMPLLPLLRQCAPGRWFRFLLLPVLLAAAFGACATVVPVGSIVALQAAANGAAPGDTLVLANGTYPNSTLTLGSGATGFTIRAATPGGVFLNGSTSLTLGGSRVVLSGFQFTSGAVAGVVLTVTGNYNTLTQLNFNGYSAAKYVRLVGHHNVLSYSNFQGKPATATAGNLVQVDANAAAVGYNVIRYCSFQHLAGTGGDNGNECIRLGEGAMAAFAARTLVEYCYFEDTGLGDSEAISVKSRENCLRYNTMRNNPDAMFSFRNGSDNVAYGNFFLRSGGIRVKQSNNIACFNNYFEESGLGQTPGLPGGGTRAAYVEYYGPGYGSGVSFVHNTFYRCGPSQLDAGTGPNNTWANNLFDAGTGTLFSGTGAGTAFAGNLYAGTLGLSSSAGFMAVNPFLARNADGYFGLTAGSPAIDAASPAYPTPPGLGALRVDSTLRLDIQQQARPAAAALKDVGCDEFSPAPVANRPLTLCQVGPAYLCRSGLATAPAAAGTAGTSLFPNPGRGRFELKYDGSPATFLLRDALGRIVFTAPAVGNGSTVDLSPLAAGVYHYQLCQADGLVRGGRLVLE